MKNGKGISEKSLRKKPFSKKVLCSMCTLMLASVCANSLTLANTIKFEKQEFAMKEPQGALDSKVTKSENFERVGEEESKEKQLSMQLPPQLEASASKNRAVEPSGRLGSVSTQYTMEQLANMSYSNMVEAISSASNWQNFSDLFKYNSGNQKFYEDKYRVQALVDAIKDKGRRFTSSDDQGIPMLIEVLRAGYYLGFSNKGLDYLATEEEQNKALPAIKSIQNNANYRLGNEICDEVVRATGALVWNSASDAEVVNNDAKIIKQYIDNFDSYSNELSKGNALYQTIASAEYTISSFKYSDPNYQNSSWYGRIDGFIDQAIRLALLGTTKAITDDNGWVFNNGIYALGTLGKVESGSKKAHKALTDCLSAYEYLGEQYFEAIGIIEWDYDSKDVNGKFIDMTAIKADGVAKFIGKTYKFDGDSIVVHAGDKVTEEKVQRLYWALREVRSQVYRNIGIDEPLELGNKDDVLSVYLYNNPNEYKMNSALFGLSTDNGGMYMEGDGAFYTYERTTEESIYTLEELFRHEFTHYLQGRFIAPGLWGTGSLYADGKLNWFEEGGAELFAGSTRENVKIRQSMASQLLRFSPEERYSIRKTVHSTYDDGWDFYTFSWALEAYFINHRVDLLDKLTTIIQADDLKGYNSFIEEISSDTALNNEYQRYMQKIVDNYANYDIPLVSDVYLNTVEDKDLSSIKRDVVSVSNISNANVTKLTSQFFDTFTVKGEYVGGRSEGKLEDRKKMNEIINGFISELDQKRWSGYKTVTAYFVNHRVNSNGDFVFDLVFGGKLGGGSGQGDVDRNQKPTAVIVAKSSGEVDSDISFSSKGSSDSDGEIVKYSWHFGDGGTSTEANPKHKYEEDGNYTVKLTVQDNGGATAYKTHEIIIGKGGGTGGGPVVGGAITTESEPNDSRVSANGPIVSGTKVSGGFSNGDANDYYYFDVKEEGECNISLDSSSDSQFTWTVSPEGSDEYVAYPSSGNKGSFVAKPGRYYLSVYTWNSGNIEYTINIDKAGEVTPNPDPKPDPDPDPTPDPDPKPDPKPDPDWDEDNIAPIAKILSRKKGKVGKEIIFNGSKSSDEDGEIESYNWNFGDGSTSTEIKPKHVFTTEGTYEVSLTVTDDSGESSTITKSISITGKSVASGITKESEPNNSFDKANGNIGNGVQVSAAFKGEDNEDIFSFEVLKKGQLDILVKNNSDAGISWMLFKEGKTKLHQSVAYDTGDNVNLTGSYTAQPGKYYLYVYKYSGKDGEYKINVNGSLK